MFSFFITTPKAMEDILADELRTLGIAELKTTIAGASFDGSLQDAYRVCLWSRIANRVLLKLHQFKASDQNQLYDGVQEIDWSRHLAKDGSIAVSFNAKNSKAINNTHFGALKVKDAIIDQMRDRFGQRPSIDTERPDIRIQVMLKDDMATVSLDLSGESLHRRSYRETRIKAPIKENLAAALLMRSGWPLIAAQGGALLDPMCGSGTLITEGALMAADIAPGLLRDYFGFKGWKQHDAECWQSLIYEALQRKSAGLKRLPMIVGFDHDRRNLKTAADHIAEAGLTGKVHLECRDISQAAPAAAWKPGLVICNPPYGERLGEEAEIAMLYKRFGDTLKANFKHWRAGIIISNLELGFRLGIRAQKPTTFYNGALECKLLRFNIEESAFFTPQAKTDVERIDQIKTSQADALSQPIPTDASDATIDPDAESIGNRLRKNYKKLSGWAKENEITCYRIYDADIPEFAAAIDLYQDNRTWIVVQEYEPPKTIDPHKANKRLALLLNTIPRVLDVNPEQVFFKLRRKQKHTDQYEKLAEEGHFHTVTEHGCRLRVNFTDYLDTGLFLDHRPIRLTIQQQAKGKRFLNLFAYTGSATVHAAVGGASSTTTIDMSRTYIDWAKSNLALNNTTGQHEFVQADCLTWLKKESEHPYPRQFDLIFLDPPTFSNSKRMDNIFDVQQDHPMLIQQAVKLLAPGGTLYFSTNFRRFKLDKQAMPALNIEDISAKSIPYDFSRNPRIHYCWRIQK